MLKNVKLSYKNVKLHLATPEICQARNLSSNTRIVRIFLVYLLPFFWAYRLAEVKSVVFIGKVCNVELVLEICAVEVQATSCIRVLKCSRALVMSTSFLKIKFESKKFSST